jgi:hypothetical protein
MKQLRYKLYKKVGVLNLKLSKHFQQNMFNA